MISIDVQNLTKRFRVTSIPKQTTFKEAVVKLSLFRPDRSRERYIEAVNDVSFSVPTGSTVGIVGRNGSGKTTLMRLLGGVYRADSGTIKVSGDLAPLLSLGLGFHPDMTGRENVKISGLVLGMSPKQIERRFDEIVEFSELEDAIDVPVRTYSSGMYMRLAFAVAVSVDPDVLLLDEILAVGDEAFAAKCLDRMQQFKRQGKTIAIVSHDSATLQAWCDTAVWMEAGRLKMRGAAADVIGAYHESLHIARPESALHT